MFNINGRTGNLMDAALVLALCASLVGYGRLLQAVDNLESKVAGNASKELVVEQFKQVEKETKRLADELSEARLVRVQLQIDVGAILTILEGQYGTATIETE